MSHFIAIGLPDELRGQIADLIPHDRSGVNWVVPEKLHMTLFFCGRLDDAQCESVIQEIDRIVLPDAPFACPINGVDGFKDNSGNYRVLYLSVEKTDDLANLQSIIASAVNPIVPRGKTHDEYRPHITLGRPTAWDTDKCQAFIERHPNTGLGPLPVDHIALYQSVSGCQSLSGQGGHRYIERHRWPFTLD